MVTELSRLCRSLIYILKLIEYFKQQTIYFKSLDLVVDPTVPAGELVMNVFAV
ncbi:MAG: recombinase family protein [Solitalea-like symbiont of Acarus siro]